MTLGGKGALAKPLTRSTKAGIPYTRPPDIDAQLEELLHASADEQLTRANIADKTSSLYVSDECLVYLARQAALANDSELYNILACLLLKRVMRGIERKLRILGVAEDDVNDVHQGVVSEMFISILEGPKGEYYQVRFRSALYRQLVKSYDRYARRRRRAKREQSLDAPVQSVAEAERENTETLGELLEGREEVAAAVEQRILILEALEAIRDPRHREAFVLHCYSGWPIESIDPGDPSLSQLYNRTPRMVRNWLRTADRQLAEWRAAKRL
jgi:DNA-directed RNA polymerase specialized sigma24 family protein